MEFILLRRTYIINDKQYFYLASDLHIDESGFDEDFFKQEFDSAAERGARILLCGDIFSLILPSDRKRFSMGVLKTKNYDSIINNALEESERLLLPYVNQIDMIGVGNHEASVVKHNSIDPIYELIGRLNAKRDMKRNGRIAHGGYSGFIRYCFGYGKSSPTNGIKTFDIYYNHGQGGLSEVSKGTIDLQRRHNINADVVWLGHKHQRIVINMDPVIGVSARNCIYSKERRGILTGCFCKAIHTTNSSAHGYKVSFSEEKIRSPQNRGGVFITLRFTRGPIEVRVAM